LTIDNIVAFPGYAQRVDACSRGESHTYYFSAYQQTGFDFDATNLPNIQAFSNSLVVEFFRDKD
jgi:hypothetical protein